MTGNSIDRIREILQENARLEVHVQELADGSDLFEAGLNSSNSVNVLFALEDEFGITIPENMLSRKMFSSVSSINAVVSELLDARLQCSGVKKLALVLSGFFGDAIWMFSVHVFEPAFLGAYGMS